MSFQYRRMLRYNRPVVTVTVNNRLSRISAKEIPVLQYNHYEADFRPLFIELTKYH